MSVILTEEEKARRKAIWDKMTPEEQEDAENRKNEIINWSLEEEKKIVEKLEKEGKFGGTLDGNHPELVEHNKERRQRLHNLLVSIFGEEP